MLGVIMFLVLCAFISNVALAVVPHEPVVIWYGSGIGIWTTAGAATLGTAVACWVDHRLFVPLVQRALGRDPVSRKIAERLTAGFNRAPFAILALSGLTPLPLVPFKTLAFAARYPLREYLAAMAIGRFPRYALLAWLGAAYTLQAWVMVLIFVLLLIPSIGAWVWQRANVN